MNDSSVSADSLPTRTLLLGLWRHLSRRRQLQVWLLLVLMLISGMAEMMSLGAVLPFLAAITDTQRLWDLPVIQDLAGTFGLTSANQLLLPATFVFASVAVLAALIRIINLWLNGRLAAAVGTDLSCEAFRRTLYQPYVVHVQRNSAAAIATSTTQTAATVVSLYALLRLVMSTVVATCLLAGLLIIDAPLATAAAATFVTAYLSLFILTRRELRVNSKKIADASIQQVKALQEGLGAIREVLLDGNQPYYLKLYRDADYPQRHFQARNVFLGSFPRFALEALGIVSLAMFAGFISYQKGNSASAVPIIGAFALGAQRLLPALQQVYSGYTALKGHNAAIHDVLLMLDQPISPEVNITDFTDASLNHCIQFEHVDFCYQANETSNVLNQINLNIRSGEKIGIIGPTGSGKSTLIDLIMGLLPPSSGRIMIDGLDLHESGHPERLLSWRSKIAHVPQTIYLSDSSIAENIAFGVPGRSIDMSQVKLAALGAQLSSFIESCPDGYNTFVGERGVRLSGGQRQRIGIARALYKDARVILFDEATSALDSDTEAAVMNSIDGLNSESTIIIIAHRLSTIQSCDRVIKLVDGTIALDGPPSLVLEAQA